MFWNTAHTDKEMSKYETETRCVEMAQKFQTPCNGVVESQQLKKYWQRNNKP